MGHGLANKNILLLGIWTHAKGLRQQQCIFSFMDLVIGTSKEHSLTFVP